MNSVTISEELAAFRAGFPGCHAVAFADLSTGMVLASNTVEKTTQEKLDALCEKANEMLLGPEIARLTQALAGAGKASTVAWVADATAIRCFVKAPEPASEALCLVVSTEVALESITESARHLLTRIVSEA